MNYRELGRTGWKVSEVSFGAWAIGSEWGRVDDSESYATLNRAFDRGETFSGVDFETGLRAVEELKKLVPADVTMAQFALRWILMFDAVTCAIPGAKRPSQVEENVHASDLPPLTEGQMAAVRRIYAKSIREAVHDRW